MKRPKERMSIDHFKKAVDEFAAMNGNTIDFNVTIGEPLLDNQLLKRARYVKTYPQFKSNGFVTTLQWLHLFNMDEFFDSGLTWLSISTVLSGRQQYLNFFGVDKYEQMLANLTMLLLENNRRGKPIHVNIDLKPTNEARDAILKHPDFCRIKELYGQELEDIVIQRGFFVDDWHGAVMLPEYLRRRPLYPRNRQPCRMLYRGMIVYSNGKVGACSCRDFNADSELILGHIQEHSLKDMWAGEKLENLRKNWKEKNIIPAICRECRYYLY